MPNPNRAVHPGIADPAPGLTLRAAPLFAVPDGQWNHGEGFRPNDQNDEDNGAWFADDDGSGLEVGDVHPENPSAPWSTFQWSSPDFPGSPVGMLRLEGWLRPAATDRAIYHPLYGNVGPYVDQGAFEAFIPQSGPAAGQRIALIVCTRETTVFPRDASNQQLAWRQIYPGIFSPDGLERWEMAPGGSAGFINNTDDSNFDRDTNTAGVIRPTSLQALAAWIQSPDPAFWPIAAYPVISVMHRQSTLNEQRYLQLVQALKLMLQEPGPINPLGAGNALTAEQVEQRCVVCFAGNSNGGLAAEFATLRHPRLVHAAFAQVINASYQRLYGELDMSSAVSRLSGTRSAAEALVEDDFLHWNQYVWAQGIEMHDISYLREFLAGRSYRPSLVAVGDEDITSTGVDFARMLNPAGTWTDHGIAPAPATQGYEQHEMAWTIAENGCHQRAAVPAIDPYTNSLTFHMDGVANRVIAAACAQRAAEETNPSHVPPPATPLVHHARTDAQELRGLDDPHEWFFGRVDAPLVATTPPLARDDAFFAAVQPDTCGTLPGQKEAMLERDGVVYVGSADGFVTALAVDTMDPKQPLRKVARSARLGHCVRALAVLDNGMGGCTLLAGTRRHLHRLDPTSPTLAAAAPPVLLPWEVGQPHHLQVGDVLPGHAGLEVVFASQHGGLVFYSTSLAPIHEWPEPGIVDFAIQGSTVTILSSRNMLANVTFSGPNHTPTLVAASDPIPADLLAGLPTQGTPGDLELMQVDWTGFGWGNPIAAMSTWAGDRDAIPAGGGPPGVAIRGHGVDTLVRMPWAALPGLWVDLATCHQGGGSYGAPDMGNHLLALGADGTLILVDQFGVVIGEKKLTTTVQGYWPFGLEPHAMLVAELVTNSGDYEQEIVVATSTGLMWLHVNDLLTSGTSLPAAPGNPPSGYWMDVARTGGSNTAVQPRTNQTLASAWALARRPDAMFPSGFDDQLHVLDQRGSYWRVAYDGTVDLWERDDKAVGARGWSWVGAVNSAPLTFTSPAVGGYLGVTPASGGDVRALIETTPWGARFGGDAVYQFATPAWNIIDNWLRWPVPRSVFDGFLAFERGGSVSPHSGGGCQAWMWSSGGGGVDWGNLVEGYRITNGVVDGTWSSVAEPSTTSTTFSGTASNHLRLRSFTAYVPSMSQQAVHAVELFGSGETRLVLGCPGGRARIVSPGNWRTGDASAHSIGSIVANSIDLGHGGGALAVRHEGDSASETLRIFLGTVVHPTKLPASYHLNDGVLDDDEVAAGAVHMLTWQPGNATVQLQATLGPFHPTGATGGAYGVVGLKIGDVLAGEAGDELVVATMSGDVIVYSIGPAPSFILDEKWSTQLHGSIGFYNSIAIEDLNDGGLNELYVAGSLGLWRFTQPGEGTPGEGITGE